MRLFYLLTIIYVGLYLSGCTTTSQSHSTITHVAANHTKILKSQEKSPLNVAVYTAGETPKHPYKVLGTETISKFNYCGIKRQAASIHDAMRNLAAKMGGDAIINVAHDDKTFTGTVISYQVIKQKKTTV